MLGHTIDLKTMTPPVEVEVAPFPQHQPRVGRVLDNSARRGQHFRHQIRRRTPPSLHTQTKLHTTTMKCAFCHRYRAYKSSIFCPHLPLPGANDFPFRMNPLHSSSLRASALLIHNNTQDRMTRTTCDDQETYFLELMSRPVSLPQPSS